METIVAKATPQAVLAAGKLLRKGSLVAFPTETVYGLGADALRPDAAREIYETKGRPSDNPLIVHIGRCSDLRRVASSVPDTAWRLADAFWPGPLTMILPKASVVPYETTGGLDTVAVRFPSHPVARRLIEAAGVWIAAPSANRSGRPSPTTAQHVLEDFNGRIPMVLDGGPVRIGLESTIVDLTQRPPMILRPGFVTKESLEGVLGSVEMDPALLSPDSRQGSRPKAPGMRYRHYAPKGRLTIVEGPAGAVAAEINRRLRLDHERGLKTGVIATERTMGAYQADCVLCAGGREDEEAVARSLYAMLRRFDELGVEAIYSEAFPDAGLGQSIMNRLLRAAGHEPLRAG